MRQYDVAFHFPHDRVSVRGPVSEASVTEMQLALNHPRLPCFTVETGPDATITINSSQVTYMEVTPARSKGEEQ